MLLIKTADSVGEIHKNSWSEKTELHHWHVINGTKYPALKLKSPHFHDEYQIGFVSQGVIENNYRKKKELIGTQEIYRVQPGEVHAENLVQGKELKFSFMFFSADMVSDIICESFGSSCLKDCFGQLRLDSRANTTQLQFTKELFLAFKNGNQLAFESHFLHLTANEITGSRPLVIGRNYGRETKAIAAVKSYLQEFYYSNVSLEALAAIACMSKFHLLRSFQKETGITIHRFQMHLRICKAKQLLGSGQAPSQVAFELGFTDLPHFSKTFKRFTSQTPTQFYMG